MGIDYGRIGQVNRNRATGIHYGVISQNSLDSEAINDAIMEGADYGKAHCPKCGTEAHSSDIDCKCKAPTQDYHCPRCKEILDGKKVAYSFWSDECFSEEMIRWSHESDGYKLTDWS